MWILYCSEVFLGCLVYPWTWSLGQELPAISNSLLIASLFLALGPARNHTDIALCDHIFVLTHLLLLLDLAFKVRRSATDGFCWKCFNSGQVQLICPALGEVVKSLCFVWNINPPWYVEINLPWYVAMYMFRTSIIALIALTLGRYSRFVLTLLSLLKVYALFKTWADYLLVKMH